MEAGIPGTPRLRVLLIEDNPADADLVREAVAELRTTPPVLEHERRLDAGLARLPRERFDAVLLDLSLPDASGLDGLRRLHAAVPWVPVVVLTGQDDKGIGLSAVNAGAQDYLLKGEVSGALLMRALAYAVERQQYAMRTRQLAEEQAGRRAAEEGLRRSELLAEASKRLGRSLNCPAALQALMDVIVPRFADWSALELAEPTDSCRSVLAHADPARATAAGRAREELGECGRTTLGAEALGAERSVLLGNSEELAGCPEQRAWLREHLGAGTALVVPLRVRDRGKGTLVFCRTFPAARFSDEEALLAEEIGRRAASALENAALYHEAREAIAVRDEFLSIASHELRTPLAAVQLSVQKLERTLKRDEAALCPRHVAPAVEVALRQVRRMSRLVDALLDVSRVNEGKLLVQREPIELGRLCAELIERLDGEAQQSGARVRLSAAQEVCGLWDRTALERILTNLLTNALKYAPGSEIWVEVRCDGDEAVLRVADRGVGIAAADLARIFGRFERASSARHFGGLGLGLYITRQLVEALGGSISVESSPGAGSVFTVRLPTEFRAAERVALGPDRDTAS